MREKFMPWLPAVFCALLSLITVIADIVGRFATGSESVGLTTFLCFLPICFLHVGVMLKKLDDDNRSLRQQLDKILQANDDKKRAA